MRLACGSQRDDCVFERVPVEFYPGSYTDVFALKNNKTLGQTLSHQRYSNLRDSVLGRYPAFLEVALGTFLLDLKSSGDTFYKQFLNPYGDSTYSHFYIAGEKYLRTKGVYLYAVGGAISYIGRCKDRMSKRVNQGYGKIHPKNCFRDGQATNCHLNSRITEIGTRIELWLCAIGPDQEIEERERALIRAYNPPWNIQRYT
jgi:hypothetical protein